MAEQSAVFESSYSAIDEDENENERKSWRYYVPVTVEPAVFLFSVGFTLPVSVTTNLFMVHACENSLGFNHTVCLELGDKTYNDTEGLEPKVQHIVTYYTLGKSLMEAIIPATLAFYTGPWSDVNGRKPIIMWSMIGFTLTYLLLLAASLLPKLPVMWLMFSSLPAVCCGGFISFISGMYSYVSDVSKPEQRTLRLGMIQLMFFCGVLTSHLLVSFIYKAAGQWGYVTVFGVSATCCLLAWLYCCFFVKESVVNEEAKYPYCCLFAGLFKREYVSEMIATCFEKRQNHTRTIMLMLFFVLGSSIAVVEGDRGVTFLFTREKFGWGLHKFSIFAAVSLAINIVGLLFGTHVLGSWLHLTPALLAAFAFLMKIISEVVTAVSPASWYMYIGAVVALPGACILPWCRSILSTTVSKSDIGKVFAVAASVESLMPIAITPIYSLLYNATIQSFPGAFCLISASVYTIDMALLICILIFQYLNDNIQNSRTRLIEDRNTEDK